MRGKKGPVCKSCEYCNKGLDHKGEYDWVCRYPRKDNTPQCISLGDAEYPAWCPLRFRWDRKTAKFVSLKKGERMKYRRCDWYDMGSDSIKYGIRANVEPGKWCHCIEDREPLIYLKEEDRDAKLKELRAKERLP